MQLVNINLILTNNSIYIAEKKAASARQSDRLQKFNSNDNTASSFHHAWLIEICSALPIDHSPPRKAARGRSCDHSRGHGVIRHLVDQDESAGGAIFVVRIAKYGLRQREHHMRQVVYPNRGDGSAFCE
jgi:hypothetical protein